MTRLPGRRIRASCAARHAHPWIVSISEARARSDNERRIASPIVDGTVSAGCSLLNNSLLTRGSRFQYMALPDKLPADYSNQTELGGRGHLAFHCRASARHAVPCSSADHSVNALADAGIVT